MENVRGSVPGTRATQPPTEASAKPTDCGVRPPVADSARREILTCKDFQWGLRNPIPSIFTWDNNYITEMWSEEFFTASKNDVGLFLESLKNVVRSLGSGHPLEAGGHLVNAVAIALMGFVNIEVFNFLKGVLGIVVSAIKFVLHTTVGLACGVVGTFMFLVTLGNNKGLLIEFMREMGFAAKDIVSIVSAVGHSIPSWLPLLIFAVCPPAGVALAIIKVMAKFTGGSDVMGYGGSGLLLWAKTKVMPWERWAGGEAENKAVAEAENAKAAWENMKRELNPTQSTEGGLLAMFGVHVLTEGVTSVIDAFVPGAGTAVKYTGYGVQAVAAGFFGWNIYQHNKAQQTATDGKTSGAAQRLLEQSDAA